MCCFDIQPIAFGTDHASTATPPKQVCGVPKICHVHAFGLVRRLTLEPMAMCQLLVGWPSVILTPMGPSLNLTREGTSRPSLRSSVSLSGHPGLRCEATLSSHLKLTSYCHRNRLLVHRSSHRHWQLLHTQRAQVQLPGVQTTASCCSAGLTVRELTMQAEVKGLTADPTPAVTCDVRLRLFVMNCSV